MRLSGVTGRLVAAVLTAVLLLVPLVLAGLPRFTDDGFPGPHTRTDALVVFFVAVPLLFGALAAYRTAQYYGIGPGQDDRP